MLHLKLTVLQAEMAECVMFWIAGVSDYYVVPLTSHASSHFVALGQILFNNRPLDLHRNNGALHYPATHG